MKIRYNIRTEKSYDKWKVGDRIIAMEPVDDLDEEKFIRDSIQKGQIFIISDIVLETIGTYKNRYLITLEGIVGQLSVESFINYEE